LGLHFCFSCRLIIKKNPLSLVLVVGLSGLENPGTFTGGYGRIIGTCFYLGGEFGVSGPITNKEERLVDQSSSTESTVK